MTKQNNIRIFETQQTILAALILIMAFCAAPWFLAYRVYTTSPATETITVTLPPQTTAIKGGLVEPLQTVEIVREKPERKWFSALLHPLGFGVLMLVIIGAGFGLILLIVWLGEGERYGRK